MSLATLKARIDAELSMNGSFDDTNDRPVKTSIIADSVRQFVRKYEPTDLSETLTYASEISIPDSLEKIVEIYDGNNDKLTYHIDMLRRKIWFDTIPLDPVVAYGTPNKISTNLSDIIDAFDEDYEDIIWAYIRANAMKTAKDPDWKTELQYADKLCLERRQSRNRTEGMKNNTVLFKDRTGALTDNPSNIEGQVADYPNFGVVDDL